MTIRSITQARNLGGKRILVRVDFNVPLKGKTVADDARLSASLPTIQYLLDKKAKVILVTHLGRPEGKAVPALSVKPVAKRLSELLGRNINVVDLKRLKSATATGGVPFEGGKLRIPIVMLENIRFSPDEQGNKGTLAKDLAALADIFVLDGFAVAHRGDASVSGVAKYLPSYAGLLLDKEITRLNKIIAHPTHPFVVVLGGAKIETKIPVMKNLLAKADHVLIGGGLLNTYLAGKGYGIGDSLVDHDFMKDALKYCAHKKVVRSVDVMVGTQDGKNFRVVTIGKKPHTMCEKGEGIYDMGTNTVTLFQKYIREARTLVWNGAMGYFEQEPYNAGTKAVAELIAAQSKKKTCFGVIGGGETVQSVLALGLSGDIDLVSTGGGAMLEFLAGEKLSGIVALEKSSR